MALTSNKWDDQAMTNETVKATTDNSPVLILGIVGIVAVLVGLAIQSYAGRSNNLLSDAAAHPTLAMFGTILAIAGGICLLAAIIIGVVKASGTSHE